MFAQTMYIAFFVVISELVLSNLIYFGLAIRHDIQKIRQTKRQACPKSLLRSRPTIDVIIYCRNNANGVEQSLNSLFRQAYRNYRIIVIDDNSSDQSRAVIRRCIAAYPKIPLRLVAKTKYSQRGAAIWQVAKKYVTNDWLLVMDAGCLVGQQTLHQANQSFVQNKPLDALIPNIQIQHNDTVNGLLQQVRQQLSLSTRKALQFDKTSARYNHAAFYRKQFVSSLRPVSRQALDDIRKLYRVSKQQGGRLAFDEMIVIGAPALVYKTRIRTMYKTPFKALQPFVIVYVAYVAIVFGIYDYLLLAFSTFLVVLMLNIAADRSQRLPAKFHAGIMGIPMYAVDVVDNLITTLLRPFYLVAARR